MTALFCWDHIILRRDQQCVAARVGIEPDLKLVDAFIEEQLGPRQQRAEPAPMVEVMLANGRCMRFPADLEVSTLARLIRAIEAR